MGSCFFTGAFFFFLLLPKSAEWPFFFDPNPIGSAADFFRRASLASRSFKASASARAAFSPVGSDQSLRGWTSIPLNLMRAERTSRNAMPASDSSPNNRAASSPSLRQSAGQASSDGATA